MTRLLFIAISLLVLTSCVSGKKLLEYSNSDNLKSLDLNHTYGNPADSMIEYSLAEKLIRLNRITVFEKRIPEYKNLDTKLEYDGNKTLKISLFDSVSIKEAFTLKVKNKGNYLSIKRKCLFIPIPLFFFVYKNRKALLFNDNNGSLTLLQGDSQFIWVFIANGNQSIEKSSFELKKE